MGLLARIFCYVPRAERDGIQMDYSNAWEVTPATDASEFLRHLKLLVSDGCNLYVEGTIDRRVAAWLLERSASHQTPVAIGTIWPRPDRHHVPATSRNLDDLAGFLDSEGISYPWIHVHAYCGRRVVLAWHDAFDQPIYVSSEIDTERVDQFARGIGCTYDRIEDAS